MQERTIERLVFVFAADSGAWNAMMDSARKVLRLNGCALCAVTHGLTSEKREMRACREELGVPIEYLHRDEVTAEVQQATGGQLPAVVAATGDGLYHPL